MEGIRIKLSGIWVSLMLTYLLGDVLRIFSGDYTAGEMAGMNASEVLYLAAAFVMLIPIVMVFLTLILKHRVNRWANIVLAIFLFLFNLVGLPGYVSLYDQFLIVISLVFNGLTVWYAWKWQEQNT